MLTAEVNKHTENIVATINPSAIINLKFDFVYFDHSILKIAYELAFLWLGKSYLDDPTAEALRTAICSPEPESTAKFIGVIRAADGCEAFSSWSAQPNHHLAHAIAVGGGIAMSIRIFNIYAAVIWVTINANKYLSGSDAEQKLRFFSIDTVTGHIINTTLKNKLDYIKKYKAYGQIINKKIVK